RGSASGWPATAARPSCTGSRPRVPTDRLPVMSAVRAGIALALLSGLGVFQACSTAAPSGVASVPIQTINRKFLVPVVLNEGQTATFLLDTGASTSVITPDLARRLGLDTSSRAPRGRARIASGQEVEVSMVR